MKIKVCGITTQRQVDSLLQMQVDYIGFIFYPSSKRYMQQKIETPLSASAKLTGVFVNPMEEDIEKALKKVPSLSVLQLHGKESVAFCEKMKNQFEIIKAFSVDEHMDIETISAPYNDVVDYFLFDTKTSLMGGSGMQFNWTVLENKKISKPFMLSGGIGAQDIQKVQQFKHPKLYGVDINSKFEIAPGIKDLESVQMFINKLKS